MDVWRALPEGPLFRSARLDCALTRLSGALVCERERETLLALPYDDGAPFLSGACRHSAGTAVRFVPAG